MVWCSLVCGNSWAISLMSTDIKNNSMLPQAQLANNFGCSGGNKSPELSWVDAPKSTKSFAVTAYDPDAPTGSGFWHWIVYDINPNTNRIVSAASKTNSMPVGSVEGPNDAGFKEYVGVCPPPGTAHHYIFTVYALDVVQLPVKNTATSAIIRINIMAHTIAKASIITIYSRH